MATIINKLRQPVTVNLSDGTTMYFLAGETKKIALNLVNSVEIQNLIKNKSFVILSLDIKEEN